MSRQKIPWLPVYAVAILGVAVAVMKSSRPAVRDDPEEIPSIQAAKDQEDALQLAQKIDLPLLAKADKVVIEESVGGRRHTIEKADEIKELREALKVSEQQPSGGKNAVTILFYRKTTWSVKFGSSRAANGDLSALPSVGPPAAKWAYGTSSKNI
jgi:hypothetical protein